MGCAATTVAASLHARGGARGVGAASPFLDSGELVLLLAREQVDQAALDALALVDGVVHLLGDGHLHSMTRGELERRVNRVRALSHAGQRALDLGPLATLGKLHPERVVARQR